MLAWVLGQERLDPDRLAGILASVSGAYALYARAWFPTLCAIFISVLAHVAHYTTFWCAAKSLEDSGPRKPSALELYSALPIIEGVAAIPIDTPTSPNTRLRNFIFPRPNQESSFRSRIGVTGN